VGVLVNVRGDQDVSGVYGRWHTVHEVCRHPIAHPCPRGPLANTPLTFTFTLFIAHDRLIPRSRFSASVVPQPCTTPHPRTCNNSKDVVIVNPPEFICVSITVFSSSLLPQSHNPHIFACLSVLVTLPSMAPFNISMFIVIMVLRPDPDPSPDWLCAPNLRVCFVVRKMVSYRPGPNGPSSNTPSPSNGLIRFSK
jgi:hypothetical protein